MTISGVQQAGPAPSWKISVLGPVRIANDTSKLRGRGRQLLAVLVAAGPGGIAIEALRVELWPDKRPRNWRHDLGSAINTLSEHLARLGLVIDIAPGSDSVALRAFTDEVDLWDLRERTSGAISWTAEIATLATRIHPFQDVHPSEFILGAISQAREDQLHILRSLQAARWPSPAYTDAVAHYLAAAPDDVDVWDAGLRIIARSDSVAAARDVVARAETGADRLRGQTPRDLRELLLSAAPATATPTDLASDLTIPGPVGWYETNLADEYPWASGSDLRRAANLCEGWDRESERFDASIAASQVAALRKILGDPPSMVS